MKVNIRKLLAAVAVLGVVLAGAGAVSASTAGASASAVPVLYGAHLDGWHAYVKPGTIYFGNGAAPFITGLRWSSWGSGSAWGTGKLWVARTPCSPAYKCTYGSRWTGVYLSTVRTHGTTRYFYRMSVEFFVSGKARWDTGWFYVLRGATVPFWQFPFTWPYL